MQASVKLAGTCWDCGRWRGITREEAVELAQQIRVCGWERTAGETRGLTFQDWLDPMDLAGKLGP